MFLSSPSRLGSRVESRDRDRDRDREESDEEEEDEAKKVRDLHKNEITYIIIVL